MLDFNGKILIANESFGLQKLKCDALGQFMLRTQLVKCK